MNSPSVFFEAPGQATARVQPVVVLAIADHHARRNAAQDRVIGTLLGSIVDGVVDIRGSLPVPHTEDEDQVAVDMDHARSLFELHNRVSPRDQVVGWYATGGTVTDHSELIQQFFGSETARPVHLLVDTRIGDGAPVSVRCFTCPPPALDRPLGPHFDEIPLRISGEAGDRAGVAALIEGLCGSGTGSGSGAGAGSGELSSDLDELESALLRLRSNLQTIHAHATATASASASAGTTATASATAAQPLNQRGHPRPVPGLPADPQRDLVKVGAQRPVQRRGRAGKAPHRDGGAVPNAGVNQKMHRPRSLGSEKLLNQLRMIRHSSAGGIPADHLVTRRNTVVELEKRPRVIHVNRDLILVLGVRHRERPADVDDAVDDRSEQGSDHAVLRGIAARVVVRDREDDHGLDTGGRLARRFKKHTRAVHF
eukprot:TRINITY_DN8289_c0_g2_i11.p1 TRINITY_DN8289_c0_g2~~TRINITY_DN8289_c0_g2_i11.p1  ORF type:complete len:426 (-),score=76.97 TRINITY_DN8289_c0_g2_i11:414-1691(-)